MKLETEFSQVLEGTIDAAKERGYVPTYLMQMLNDYSGVSYLSSSRR